MAEDESTQGRRKQTRRELAPRSDVWQNFIRIRDDNGSDKAECKRCHKELSAGYGTTSLKKHVKVCKGQETTAAGVEAARPPQQRRRRRPSPCAPSSPDATSHSESALDEASKHLGRMIALRGYDASVVEDDCFRSFVASLNPEFRVPSRFAIEEMCDGIFDEARRDLFARLRCAPGRVSLAVGTVTTIQGEVLYAACHFIDDEWNLYRVMVDACLDGKLLVHHGPLLRIDQVDLSPDSREDSFDKVICDNLFMTVWETTGKYIHLRNQIDEKTNPTRTKLISTTFMDNVIHSIAEWIVVDPDFQDEIASELKDLRLTRQKLQKILSELGLDYDLWAYDENWYWSYCSLQVLRKEGCTLTDTGSEFAELFCKLCGEIFLAIQRISASSCPTSNICLVELFKLGEVLQSVRAGGDEAVRASGNEKIAYIFSLFFPDLDEGNNIEDVLREAIERLDRSIKDSYLIWSIPLILDPRYKLAYIEFIFQRAYVHSEATSFISEVTTQIKKLYVDYLEYGAGTSSANSDPVTAVAAGSSTDPLQEAWDEHSEVTTQIKKLYVDNLEYGAGTSSANSDPVTAVAAGSSTDPLQEAWDEHCRLRDGMANEVTPSHQDADTELDRYLKDPLTPGTESFDILKWWKDNSRNYPTVARMARDALAMPTCSKLSSEQMAHVRSILRRYSKAAFGDLP